MRVLVRADASSRIGIGHLVRSLALAQALRDGGDEVLLLTSDPTGPIVDAWRQEGEVHHLDVEVGSDADADVTASLAADSAADWAVLDGYAFVARYRRRIAARRLLVVDDLGEAGVRADVIVNGHFHGAAAMYPDATGRLLVGPRYALLRRSVRTAPRATRGGVLVSLGGADPDARTGPLLEALAAAGVTGRVVIGPQHPAPGPLRATAVAHRWEVAGPDDDIVPLLASASVAVVGAGTATLECAALGTPMVAVRIADNQRPVVEALRGAGIAVTAEAGDVAAVAATTATLMADPDARRRMAEAGQRMVDGQGATRVAAAMRAGFVAVRPAAVEDGDDLLAWRNDPVTRSGSFTSDPIMPDEHRAWLAGALGDPARMLLVGELGESPVGVVRLDREGDRATISVTVAPAARGRGLAATLIRAGLERAAAEGIVRVDAFIRPDNQASLRAFAAAGFRDVEREPNDGAPPTARRMAITVERP